MLTPTITSKQLEILLLLYKFRFLNRQQIQTMLNHKTFNRVNEWLADLTEKELISRTYSKKVGENVKPAVYFLNSKSRHILKDNSEVVEKQLTRIYGEKNRSPYFREKSMFLADIFLNLKGQTDGELHFLTKSNLEAHKYLYKPLPDAYIVSTTKEQTKRYFLEIVSEQLPRFVIRKHIEYLFKYSTSGKWEQYSKHPFPTFLMVCPTYPTKAFIAKFIKSQRDSETRNLLFYLGSVDQIKSRGIEPSTWQKVA
ncbi:MAG: replication-relaxation family protein [Candidatus Woykebacteria bacterium]